MAKNKPGLSQEEIKEAKKLQRKIRTLRNRHVELVNVASELEKRIVKEVNAALGAGGLRSERNLIEMEEMLLSARIVALAGQCVYEQHNFRRAEYDPKRPGCLPLGVCSYCGIVDFLLALEKSRLASEKYFISDLSDGEKNIFAKLKLEEKQKRPNPDLGQDELKAKISDIPIQREKLRKEQEKIDAALDEVVKKSRRKALGQTRKIRKEIKQNLEEAQQLERDLAVFQAKCKHQWTKNLDVFDIKCKICGLPASHISSELSTIPGQEILPKDE